MSYIKELVWHCGVCDWIISDCEHGCIRFDADCPGCGTRKYSEFVIGGPSRKQIDASDDQ